MSDYDPMQAVERDHERRQEQCIKHEVQRLLDAMDHLERAYPSLVLDFVNAWVHARRYA